MHGTTRTPLAFLALLLALLAALGLGRDAAAQTSWVSLAGGNPGLTNDGETRNLSWLWTPGGASIRGTVSLTRTGAGVHYVFAERHLDTIVLGGYPATEYDNSPYAVSLGGTSGMRHFGSQGELGRGPRDMPPGAFSTTAIDFRFDGTVSAPDNTIITLFDPGIFSSINGVVIAGPAIYRFTAFYRGAPVDTSSWTVNVVDPLLPARTPAHWSWDAPSGTYRLDIHPSAPDNDNSSDTEFPDTLVFIDTKNVTFDRLVLNANGLAADSLGVGIGSANRPKLPITLDTGWANASAADAVGLAIAGSGAATTVPGSAVAPSSSTAANANGLPAQLVTISETFTRGAAASYSITWSCRRLDSNAIIATGTGVNGSFTMPADTGVACAFTNLGRAALRLQKALPYARRNAADQFSLAIAGPGAPAAVTTTGIGTTATGSVVLATAVVGSVYTVTEAGAAGANLPDYASTWSCSNALAGGQAPTGSGTSFNLTPAAGDDISCTFSNSVRPAADLRVRKTVTPAGARTGEILSFSVVADNLGPDPANGALLRDTPGPGLDCTAPATTATCTGTGGGACSAPTVPVASLLGSGVSLTSMPVGGSVTITLLCKVTAVPAR